MIKSLMQILSGLTGQIEHIPLNIDDVQIRGLRLSSKEINPGELFIAYPGTTNDGRLYISHAIDNGASVILYDPSNYELPLEIKNKSQSVIFIALQNLSKHISLIAGNYYAHPSGRQDIYAVTGTNGKTSCAFLISQCLGLLNNQAGFIGTIGYGSIAAKLNKSDTTTPSPIDMQRILAEFNLQDIHHVAIEASSHALDQFRIEDVNISTAIFTNLSQDHLDYHQTLEQYYLAKKRLFLFNSLKNIVINIDDSYGERLYKELITSGEKHPNIILYSLYPQLANSYSEAMIILDQESNQLLFSDCEKFNVTQNSLNFELPNNLIGQFNAYNCLAVMAALIANSYSIEQITSSIALIKPPPGRMEIFEKNNVKIVIDYAHTPDALKKSLTAIRQHFAENLNMLWCVFGCGGDRDKTKRSLMGAVAAVAADSVILTDDNPRTENPDSIIKDIEKGFTHLQKKKIFAIINDRRKAIVTALDNSHPNDVILIAGKGHEDYQIYGNQKTNYDERAFVAELIQ